MPITQNSAKPRILIVEDSFLTAEAVGDLVKRCGCEVAGAVGRVETGIEFVRKNEVDAAVVDIDLHGTASFPICNQLKQRDIPFVFLTGYDRSYVIPPEFQGTVRLSKPVDDREFETALSSLTPAQPAAVAERGNLVLDGLPASTWWLLEPRLEQVTPGADEVLETPGQKIPYVHFPVTGLVSVRTCSRQGKRIETGLVGREGLTGFAVLLGDVRSVEAEAIVQHPGLMWRIPSQALAELLPLNHDLRAHLLRAVNAFMNQVSRNVLAVGYGTIEQRLARRLLMMSMRLGTRSLALTHEGLSRVLGVRRSGVTVALHMLESRRVIRARRNLVEVLDYTALIREAGESCWTAEDSRFGSNG
jgi:CRP-like cAMP-binding protein/ActR/RegA family two-component response regulator